MRIALANYRRGEVSLQYLLSHLEGALDAGEFKDGDFLNTVTGYWGIFEEVYAYNLAQKDEGIKVEEIEPARFNQTIDSLESYLHKYCPEQDQDQKE